MRGEDEMIEKKKGGEKNRIGEGKVWTHVRRHGTKHNFYYIWRI